MGFVVEREQEKLYGWVILFNGPLGILGGIYAWYANVLFAFVVLRLLCTKVTASNKGIVASAFLAVLVSLDSFRFDRLLTDAGGGSIAVYGYGPGMFLWMSAILVGVIAVGVRVSETAAARGENYSGNVFLMIGAGIVGLVVLVSMSARYAVLDRVSAAGVERERLGAVVFKRGEVCDLDPIFPKEQIELNGPLTLEVTGLKRRPREFLEYGIPEVRFRKFDYVSEEVGDGRIMVAQKSQGPSDVVYSLTKMPSGGVYARLYSKKNDKIYFEYTWRKIGRRRCPEQAESEPLIATVLGKNEVERRLSGFGRPATVKLPAVMGKVVASEFIIKEHDASVYVARSRNVNCPTNVGVESSTSSRPLPFRFSFRLGQKFYDHTGRRLGMVICYNDSVYMFKSNSRSYIESSIDKRISRLFVSFTIRSMDDFSKLSSRSITVELEDPLLSPMSVQKMEKVGRMTQISMMDRYGNSMVIEALIE